MNIVRAFPCLTPFPVEIFGLFFVLGFLTHGASWRPKADPYRLAGYIYIYTSITVKNTFFILCLNAF